MERGGLWAAGLRCRTTRRCRSKDSAYGSATIRRRPGFGPWVSLTQTWGEPASALHRLWEDGASELTAQGTVERRLGVEVGYGFPAFGGRAALMPLQCGESGGLRCARLPVGHARLAGIVRASEPRDRTPRAPRSVSRPQDHAAGHRPVLARSSHQVLLCTALSGRPGRQRVSALIHARGRMALPSHSCPPGTPAHPEATASSGPGATSFSSARSRLAEAPNRTTHLPATARKFDIDHVRGTGIAY